MIREKKEPAIRFKGFSGEWEEKKLGKILKIGSSKRVHREDYVNAGIPFFRGLEISKLGKSTKLEDVLYISKESYIQLKKRFGVPQIGDILITAVGTLGNSYLVSNNEPFYFKDGNLIWLSNIEINNEYLNIYIGNGVGKQRVLHSAAGSNQKALTMVNLKYVSVLFPHAEEQTQIGNFFQQLDGLIAQHQQKHDKLLQIKKALLEKMFPKQGETTPAIRFKGFSGAWEEKALDEVGYSTSGVSIESEFSNKGRYKVISIGSYSENSTYTDQGIRAALTKKTQKRILNKDDLTMILNDKTSSGRIIGRVLLIKEGDSFVYNQRTQRIQPHKEKYDSSFLYQMLNAPLIREKIIRSSQGNTQIYVNWSAIKQLSYSLPKKKEQTKIGNFFQQLDTLITQHQRQLTKLNTIKQALLAKMFV